MRWSTRSAAFSMLVAVGASAAEPRISPTPLVVSGSFDDRSAPSTYRYDAPPYIRWNMGPGETAEMIGVNAFDAVGGSDLLTTVSCVWSGVVNGSSQRIFIWQDDGSGTILNAKLVLEQSVTVANADTVIVNTYPLTTPVPVTGRFYVGFSSVSDGTNFVTAFQFVAAPAFPKRAFIGAATPPFDATAPGTAAVFPLEAIEDAGFPGYYAIRAGGNGSAFSYQGRLANAGQNYTGNADFIFTIYDRQSGGTAVGAPVAMTNVPVSAGVFSVQIPSDPSWFVNAADRYLDVQVRTPADGATYSTITPRGRIGQVPAAMVATVAQSAQTVPWSGVTDVPASVTPWSPVANGIAYSGKNVGIGTTSPQAKLHIVDGPGYQNLNVDSSFTSGTWFNLLNTSAGGRQWSLISTGPTNTEGAGALLIRDNNALAVRAAFLPDGNIGFGTTTPTRRVQVKGDGYGFSHLSNDGSGELATFIEPNAGWIGTPGPKGLQLYTNGQPRVLVTPEGRVGIGTSLPAGALDVNGSIATSGSILFGNRQDDLVILNGAPGGPNFALGITPNTLRIHTATNAQFISFGYGSAAAYTQTASISGAGNLTIIGNGFKPGGGAWAASCDPRLKHDITPMAGTLERLLSLRGYRFVYNDDAVRANKGLPGQQIGLMADEVERVFPDWVSRDKDGMRMVTERSTTALMVEALRDLRAEKDAQIETLRAEIAKRDREAEARAAENADLRQRVERLEKALSK
jgi:hypothetical protein